MNTQTVCKTLFVRHLTWFGVSAHKNAYNLCEYIIHIVPKLFRRYDFVASKYMLFTMTIIGLLWLQNVKCRLNLKRVMFTHIVLKAHHCTKTAYVFTHYT